jgi:hypothetical protein
MVRVKRGGKAYLDALVSTLMFNVAAGGAYIYHDRKAIMKPSQEKKKVRPYLSTGLRTGIERAFLLIGLISGALHNWETAKGMSGGCVVAAPEATVCVVAVIVEAPSRKRRKLARRKMKE